MSNELKTHRRHWWMASVAMAACMLSSGAAWAQAAKWPSKPIKIVVAFPPGGLTDAYARNYGEYLSGKLGVPVVIENKPGAGAIIGIDSVAKSPADGYTFVMSTSGTFWQNRVLYSKLPYNLDKDLTPVTVFPSGPLVVGIPDKIPAKNMAEFRSFLASSGNKAVMCPDVYPAASSKKVLYLLYMCPYHSSAYLGLPVHTPMYLVFLYYYISSVLILVCCAGADDASSSRPHTLVAEGRIY